MNVFLILLLIISDVMLCYTYYVKNFMGSVTFTEIAYLISNDASGGGNWTVVWDAIKPCIWLFVLALLVFIIVISLFNKKWIKVLATLIITIGCTVFLVNSTGIIKYYNDSKITTDVYEKYYVDTNKVNVSFNNGKRNLIILYLESMEASLFSKENGGVFNESRIPELEKIALENINFSNTNKLGGGYTLEKTAFTVGSLTASNTGTPINSKLFNGYSEKNPFMKNVRTLGDILKSNGYNLELIQGSDARFGATDMFYKLHGNSKIFDYNAIKEKELVDKNYFVWWGIEDKKLLYFARDEILELSKKEAPFAISIFTMDTHFKDGYIDDSCKLKFKDHLSNSYSCNSKIINSFITWLKEQSFYNNTTIVIMGDHQVMQDSYYKKHKDYTRTTYNAFINSQVKGNNKNREFSAFDMYPTILASMGATIDGNKLGFGVNLFSGEKTLIELLGRDIFNEEILKSSNYYDTIIMSN